MTIYKIKFGPAGLGSVKDAEKTLLFLKENGLEACEIAFTYGVYINKEEAEKISKIAKDLGISLSIHAPYWINLNSEEPEKIEKSKQRIVKCLEIGTYLNAKCVVFHAGFYGKKSKKETYENIKNEILKLQEIKKKNKYTPELAPETMGKINVFGSIEEIALLVKDTKCFACIDFAHILARSNGDYKFKETLRLFENLKELHIHFSGIDYGIKGEKNHKKTSDEELHKLISNLPKNKNTVVINESPDMINDSINALKIFKKLNQ
ncbi:MAG: TIM barrel protein [Candidatus Pacearchaeota archaeon]|jgi:deoxyribonuclease-4